jgi:hypothetical protein
MPSKATRPDRRPRGSSVWVGLDPFGDAVVARLSRWFDASPDGVELGAANRQLPGLRIGSGEADIGAPGPEELHSDVLLEPEELAESEPPVDLAAKAIEDALGEVLSAPQSRKALIHDDREVLVPHVWLIADLDSEETAGLAQWTEALYRRFRSLNVEARVLLLLRYMSWGKPESVSAGAMARCRLLVEHLVGHTTPGRTNAMIYVITDRDGVGNRYSSAESTGLVGRATDLLLLSDLAHGGDVGAERAFQAPPGGGPGGWETLPVFASMAGACLLWDAPAIARENAERRRQQLFQALSAPTPGSYEPAPPDMQQIRLTETGSWPQLDIPTWSPRFWRTPTAEDARVRDLTDTWLRHAAEWRHAMLVTHRDRSDNLDHRATSALAAYLGDLDSRERSVLDDPSLQGFFAPLHRLYDRATADLQVRRDDSRRGKEAPAEERESFDAVTRVKPPDEAMTGADAPLIRSLERKINPGLLLQVTAMTIGITWFVVAFIATAVAGWFDELGEEPELPLFEFNWDQFKAWFETLGEMIRFQTVSIVNRIVGWFEAPEKGEIILWVGLFTVVPLVAIAVFLALRQRVVIERAWNAAYKKMRGWRDTTMRTLPAHISDVEQKLTDDNIATALAEIARRRERLRAFEAAGRTPVPDGPTEDSAVTGHIRPARPAPPPLSALVVSRIVAVFKRRCAMMPGEDWAPDRLLAQLYDDAAEQAGDPVIALRDEIPLLRRRVLTSMPPDGAVRVQQLSTTRRAELSPLRVARFLGVPAGSIAEFKRDPERVTVVETPMDDRFYTLVVQTGMSARRVLSLPHVDSTAGDPSPEPAPEAEEESESGSDRTPGDPDDGPGDGGDASAEPEPEATMAGTAAG